MPGMRVAVAVVLLYWLVELMEVGLGATVGPGMKSQWLRCN